MKQCSACNRWICEFCARDDMNRCRLCPFLRAQNGQLHPKEVIDVTRGEKAKLASTLLAQGKGKGKRKAYSGGASEPTYRAVRRMLHDVRPSMRRQAQEATESQQSTESHSRAAQVQIRGGRMVFASQASFIDRVIAAAHDLKQRQTQ